jgi:hypothetical protein
LTTNWSVLYFGWFWILPLSQLLIGQFVGRFEAIKMKVQNSCGWSRKLSYIILKLNNILRKNTEKTYVNKNKGYNLNGPTIKQMNVFGINSEWRSGPGQWHLTHDNRLYFKDSQLFEKLSSVQHTTIFLYEFLSDKLLNVIVLFRI